MLREDAEKQQCLVVLLHAVPFDFTHDQLPELRKWLVAKLLAAPAGKAPAIIAVAFPVLYNSKHLPHAIFAGPGSKPEGIEALKKAAAGLPRDADIVLYCGCCPMTQCPNIRPAYRALKEMGFTQIRVLDIPTNMATDWFGKGYPFEEGQPRPSN